MHIDKAKRIIRKIQALTENLEDQGSVSSLERDLLKSYLRDLYEVVSSETGDTTQSSSPQASQELVEQVPQVTHQPKSVDPPEPSPKAPEAPVKEEASATNGQKQEQPDEQPPQPIKPEPVPVAPDPQPMRQPDAGKFRALFESKGTGDLADKLQTQSITSIEGALGINERLLTINELFDGDSKAFDHAVSHLNGLNDFDSAKQYLIEGAARRYAWDSDVKADRATNFIQIVRRKYL